ncbi:MAG TPA: SCO family protein [Burkholderiaceae bacterium]|nr:SCO family protein [Burkholderiaceae bacterium]
MRRRAVLVFAAALAMLGGCERRDAVTFNNTDITGAEFGKALALTDHTGAKRTLADYRGKVVVVFFGFTQCPDVCPTTMTAMTQVMKLLGDDAKRVQVLFVTLDPKRDTPQVLSAYVPAFDARFVGLTGSEEDIARVAKDFKVFYQKSPGTTPETYSIDHSSAMYIFDPKGQVRLYARHGQTPELLAADIAKLLKS